MRNLLLLALLSLPIFANDVYVAQTGAGAVNGTSCANAEPLTYFNTSGNWVSSGPTGIQIGPGTTVHLCGVFTATGGASGFLTFQGSGTSGLPVTLLFESGANLTAPWWGANGAIRSSSKSFITIDGGTNGIVQATANGTALANQQDGVAINIATCNTCEIKNLTVANIYVHTINLADSNGGSIYAIQYTNGNNVLIHNNIIHDTGWGAFYAFTAAESNVQIYNNHIFNCNGCVVVGSGSASSSVTGVLVHDNEINDANMWDDTADSNHHDGIHLWAVHASSSWANVQVYNNYLHGQWGIHTTGQFFIEANSGGTGSGNNAIFNNVFATTNSATQALDNGNISLQANGWKILNNTFVNDANTGSGGGAIQADSGTGSTIIGNVMVLPSTAVNFPTGTSTTGSNYNVYNSVGTSVPYLYANVSYSTLATYRTGSGQEANSVTTSPNLNSSTFVPQAGSSAIGLEANQTALCSTFSALCTDKAGITRPSSGNWVAGALNAASACAITTTTLPNGAQSTSYSQTLAQAGCSASTWSITSGALPSGLSLNASTGVLSGTPAVAGNYSFTVAYATDNQSLTLFIAYTTQPYDPPTAVTADSFNSAAGFATVQWFHNPDYSVPAYGALQGQTIYGVLSAAATATAYGHFTGTLATIDTTHIKYTAPSVLTPCHVTQGMQPYICDSIWFTRIDALPAYSSHYTGDGSGVCEHGTAYDVFCQGDPVAGTGAFSPVAPIGSTCFQNAARTVSTAGHPGAFSLDNAQNQYPPTAGHDCHVNMSVLSAGPAVTTQATVLDGNESMTTWFPKGVYGGFQGTLAYPDIRFRFNALRQGGKWNSNAYPCNSGSGLSLDNPTPLYPNCPLGPTSPFPGGVGVDSHYYIMDPVRYKTYEMFNDWLFGTKFECHNSPTTRTCNVQSNRALQWYTYKLNLLNQDAMGLAGTVENQVEETDADLLDAVNGVAIKHALAATTNGLFCLTPVNGDATWPSINWQANCIINQWNSNGPNIGSMKRLNKNRADLTGAFNMVLTNGGTGYVPGDRVLGTINGCSSIDGVHQPQVIAFIGTGGSVATNSGSNYLFIVNTGKSCVTPTVTFPAPASGTKIAATVSTINWDQFSSTGNGHLVAAALMDQMANYGMQIDDLSSGGGVNQTRQEPNITQNAENPTYQNFFGRGTLNNPFLYDWVDVSQLSPTGSGWPTNMNGISWLVDANNALEGAATQSATVTLTTTAGSVVSHTPVPLMGVGVGFKVGNRSNNMGILSGMSAIDLTRFSYVIGDEKNLGLTWTITTDPCPGADTLTSLGVYTACPAVDSVATLIGTFKATSNANPNAYAYIHVAVLPKGADGVLRYDLAGSGGCQTTPTTFSSGTVCTTSGVNWVKDCKECTQLNSVNHGGNTGVGGDATWNFARFGTPQAPLSTSGESRVYQSFHSDAEMGVSIIVPNGQYTVRNMFATHNNGASPPVVYSLFQIGGGVVEVGGIVTRMAMCDTCEVNWQKQQVKDFLDPLLVTDNVLRIGEGAYYPSSYKGQSVDQTDGNFNNHEWSGIVISPATSSTPFWELGSFVPGCTALDCRGDRFVIPSGDGNSNTINGATSPGLIQLYIRDWWTGKTNVSTINGDDPWPWDQATDAVWSVVSGPGTITQKGMYMAPTTIPASNTCALIQAKSASTPTLIAQHPVCIIDRSSYTSPAPFVTQ